MSAYFNGHIASIKPEIMTDISLLLDFVERWNKQDKESNVSQAAARVEAYLATYRENDV